MREQICPMFSTPLGVYRWDEDKTNELKDLTRTLLAERSKENDIDGGLYYVFPASATESIKNGGKSYVKVGVDFPTGDALNDMESFNSEGSPEVLELIDGWVKEHLPTVGERFDSYCHPYTMTEDSYFVMDKITDNVAVFSGGSGRAFKFGPLLGDCMRSLLTGEEAPVDLTPFSISRSAVCSTPIENAEQTLVA